MNRRTLVFGTAAVALAAFGGATWVANRPGAARVEATELPDAVNPAILVRPNSPVLGPADAPVTLVEFFDPSCEACRAFHPVVEELRREFPTELRVVLRYAAFHEGSDEAVRILEAARAQEVFEPVLNALLERQPEWAPHDGPRLDLAWAIAGEAASMWRPGRPTGSSRASWPFSTRMRPTWRRASSRRRPPSSSTASS